jgi:hypothetical protein
MDPSFFKSLLPYLPMAAIAVNIVTAISREVREWLKHRRK